MELKHAFLVTAYHDLPTLNRMVTKFSEYGDVLVHIDKRSDIDPKDLVGHEGISIYKRYPINWGSYHHLKAIVFLLMKAMKLQPDYVHVITGQDYPIVSSAVFDAFFTEHEGLSFLDFWTVPDDSWIQERYRYYWCTDIIKHPKSFDFLPHPVIGKILKWQKRFGVKRKKLGDFGIDEIYKGTGGMLR